MAFFGATKLATSFEVSPNVVSKHLEFLEPASLLNRSQMGRVYTLRCSDAAMVPMIPRRKLSPTPTCDPAKIPDWVLASRQRAYFIINVDYEAPHMCRIAPRKMASAATLNGSNAARCVRTNHKLAPAGS